MVTVLPINETAFIDGSEEASYFAGLLMIDGSFTTQRGQLRIGLAEVDGTVIERLRDYAVPGRTISYVPPRTNKNGSISKGQRLVHLPRAPFAQRLAEFGMVGLKPERRFVKADKHTWRAAVDADGSLSRDRGRPFINFVGSYNMCIDFIAFVGGGRVYRRGSIYQVFIRGVEAVRVATLLYKDSTVHLERKYAIAQAWMEGRTRWNGKEWA